MFRGETVSFCRKVLFVAGATRSIASEFPFEAPRQPILNVRCHAGKEYLNARQTTEQSSSKGIRGTGD